MKSYYVDKYFNKCKKKKIKIKIFSFLLIILFFFVISIAYFNNVFNKIVFSYCDAEVSNIIVNSANNSINKISKQIEYNNLIEIKYDTTGNISGIEAKTSEINYISNQLALTTQQEIDKKSKLGINIPLGTCTGISIFIGKGSDVTFYINPIGNVLCNLYTKFEEAGINQTSHKIYIKIESEVSLLLPFTFKRIKKENSFLISECIIIGKVPEVYFGLKELSQIKSLTY